MRVLHVICTLDPRHGGPPAVAARLSAAQAALGHSVSLAAFRRYHREDSAESAAAALAEVPGSRSVLVHWLPPATRAERLAGLASRRLLPPLVRDAEIVHLHGVWEPMLPVAAGLARRAGIPYVVRPAGMLGRWAMGQGSLKKRVALALVYRRMLEGALFLQVLNRDEADTIGPLRLRTPVRIIPSGVFLEELSPPQGAGPAQGLIPQLQDRPYVLFLSRLHPGKGLDLLAEAFARVGPDFPALHVVVAGPEFGAGPPLREQLARLGIADRFHILGPVYGPAKRALLAGAALFVLPSEHEGFSMAIVEALACGLPVVVTRECHFPEVSEVGAGLEIGRDAGEIAAAMLRILRDPAARERMGSAGRALVRQRYTWPVIAQRCIDAYSQRPGPPQS